MRRVRRVIFGEKHRDQVQLHRTGRHSVCGQYKGGVSGQGNPSTSHGFQKEINPSEDESVLKSILKAWPLSIYFLSPEGMPRTAFQGSAELLKALTKSGNAVLIGGVFFQSPLGSGVTQSKPSADMSNFPHHHIALKEATSAGTLTKKFWGPPWKGVGVDST